MPICGGLPRRCAVTTLAVVARSSPARKPRRFIRSPRRAGEERRGELQAECSRRAQVIAELDLRRPLDGKVPGRSSGQNACYVFRRAAEERDAARTVGEETAARRHFGPMAHGRQAGGKRHLSKLASVRVELGVARDQQRSHSGCSKSCEGRWVISRTRRLQAPESSLP